MQKKNGVKTGRVGFARQNTHGFSRICSSQNRWEKKNSVYDMMATTDKEKDNKFLRLTP
jgi:hypothetical protein